MARLQVRLGSNGNYNVTEFIMDHNHELASQDNVHPLRSQRKIQPAQAGLIDNLQSTGLGLTKIFNYMSIVTTTCEENVLGISKKEMQLFF